MKQGQDAERERRYEEMGILGKRYKRSESCRNCSRRVEHPSASESQSESIRHVAYLIYRHCLGHVRPPEWFRMIELPLGLFYTD